jgi:hypothetical protein
MVRVCCGGGINADSMVALGLSARETWMRLLGEKSVGVPVYSPIPLAEPGFLDAPPKCLGIGRRPPSGVMQGAEGLAQLTDALHPVLERPGQALANQRGEAFGQWVGP